MIDMYELFDSGLLGIFDTPTQLQRQIIDVVYEDITPTKKEQIPPENELQLSTEPIPD